MGSRRRAIALAVLVASLALLPATAQRREPGFGVVVTGAKDGWYTAEQAAQGEVLYSEHCARCHGVRLEGVLGLNPPLAGDTFLSRWSYRSLDQLFSYTRGTMPLDAPRTLQDQTYVRIISYVLAVNGFPAGHDPLRPDRHQLGQRYLPAPLEVEDLGLPEGGDGLDPRGR